jgi:hypothetical protein
LTTVFPTTQARYEFKKRQHYKLQLVRKIETLTEEECSKGYFVPQEDLRKAWRGETIPGGSGEKKEVQEPENEPVLCPNCGKEIPGPVSLVKHCEAIHWKKEQNSASPRSESNAARHSDEIEDVRWRLESVASLDEEPQASLLQEHPVPRENRCYTLGDGCMCLIPHSLILSNIPQSAAQAVSLALAKLPALKYPSPSTTTQKPSKHIPRTT